MRLGSCALLVVESNVPTKVIISTITSKSGYTVTRTQIIKHEENVSDVGPGEKEIYLKQSL